MSRNIRPGAGTFPSWPTQSRQNDNYSHAPDLGGSSHYGGGGGGGKTGTISSNIHSCQVAVDDAYSSQSQRPYTGCSNREDRGYPDCGRGSKANNKKHNTDSSASTNISSTNYIN